MHLLPDQRLLIQLIIRSQCTWEERALHRIAQFLEVPIHIKEAIPWDTIIASTFPLTCVGCGTVHGKQAGYPTVLTHCPQCTKLKLSPLKWEGQWLWPGEAKLAYINSLFLWPDDYTRDYILNEAMK